MSEIKTKIRTYNDVIDLFGEEKAADMLSEALDWSTIDPKNDKKNIMERKPLLLERSTTRSSPLCSEETNCLKWTSRQSDNMGYSVRNIWISVTMSMQA